MSWLLFSKTSVHFTVIDIIFQNIILNWIITYNFITEMVNKLFSVLLIVTKFTFVLTNIEIKEEIDEVSDKHS